MGVITALRAKARGKQISVFIDGSPAITLLADVAVTARLEVGQKLSESRLEELRQANSFQKCLAAAVHYLSYRPRSEFEIRQRLRHGFAGYVVDKAIAALRERKLVDDLAFSSYWKENRLLYNQRSRRLIGAELRRKGVAIETVNEVVEDVDDEIAAYEAAAKRADAVANLNYGEFYRRLYGYLQRRGFSSETVRSVVRRIWEERPTASHD